MKQRLGIAQALLHDPDLIILDEPTTGLDPQGMKEIRELILNLSEEKKKTVFLSSHILYEVELVANRMIIINKGSAKVEGNVQELLNVDKLTVTYEVNDTNMAKKIIENTEWTQKLNSVAPGKLIFTLKQEECAPLNRTFVESGLSVSAVIPTRSLEEYFLSITEKESK
jgi:ABC-type multidrug transport system ATPase subunit